MLQLTSCGPIPLPRTTNSHLPAQPADPPKKNQAKGYGVAIASANGDTGKITPVLRRVDSSTFDDPFFGGAAFQIGQHDKSNELRAIAGHYDTPEACIMFFDDGGWVSLVGGVFGMCGRAVLSLAGGCMDFVPWLRSKRPARSRGRHTHNQPPNPYPIHFLNNRRQPKQAVRRQHGRGLAPGGRPVGRHLGRLLIRTASPGQAVRLPAVKAALEPPGLLAGPRFARRRHALLCLKASEQSSERRNHFRWARNMSNHHRPTRGNAPWAASLHSPRAHHARSAPFVTATRS
jgi:hypothetical protein